MESKNESINEAKRCFIVDDHLVFAQLLARMLTAQLPLKIIGISTDVKSCLDLVVDARLDLLILDLELPDGSGVEIAEHFVRSNPDGKVIVLSAHARDFVPSGRLLGAVAAILDKTTAFEHLVAAIRALDVVEVCKDGSRNFLAKVEVLLTAREIEVFDRLGQGMTTKQIAKSMCLSDLTIATHRKHIGTKLGVKGSELVYWATRRSHHLTCSF